jgi:regulator of protease activity HflC (stomatin/prohibitin superfamily)
MKGAATFAAIAALIVVLVVLLSAAFTVEQTEQAILLRFGEPVARRGLVTTPGLHFKYPFNKPIELSVLEKAQRVVTNLYRQPADPTEKDVNAALKMLVAQERATFFNLSTNNGVKSGWVRLMKAGDV